MTAINRKAEDLEGLPRRNGELVFEAPWQGRAFGLAMAMNEQGSYEWEEFRRRLTNEIGRRLSMSSTRAGSRLWRGLLSDDGVLNPSELEGRKAEYLLMERDEVV